MQLFPTTRTTSTFSVWIVSMVIDFPLSVDLVAVAEDLWQCVCVWTEALLCFQPMKCNYFHPQGMLMQLSNMGMQTLN